MGFADDVPKIYYLPRVGFGDLGTTSVRREFGLRVVKLQPGDTVKSALYVEAKKGKSSSMWDSNATDEYKGTMITSALVNMCETIVWFYRENYRGDMDNIIKQFKAKRKTIDQKKSFSAEEMERHIDLS